MRLRLECAVFGLLLPLGVAAEWVALPLGSPPAGYNSPNIRELNDRGQVVGTVFGSGPTYQVRTFLWEDGNWTILPTLGGSWAWPSGFNNRGQVVGNSLTDDIDECVEWDGQQVCYYFVRGFVWERGQMEELGDEGFTSYAGGISNNGDVVGHYEDAAGRVAAIWDQTGRVVPLGSSLGGWVSAEDINARGQVVGSAYTGTEPHAFVWDRRGGMIDLGTLGGPFSTATAINASGVVVGYSAAEVLSCVTYEWGTSCRYAYGSFVWEDGVMTALPLLGGTFSQPSDVNDDGVIAGTTHAELISCDEGGEPNCFYRSHAVVWLDGEVIDLGEEGLWSYASAINNDWEIAGWAEGLGPVIWVPVE